MDMGSCLVQSFAGMSHHAELIALLHVLPVPDDDGAEMAIKAVVFTPVKPMLDHHVSSVVRIARDLIGMDHHAGRNRAHRIEGLAVRVPLERADVDAFVKTRVDDPGRCLDRIPDEAVAAAFPWRRFFAVIIALNILIECRPIAAKERVVLSR